MYYLFQPIITYFNLFIDLNKPSTVSQISDV